VKRDGIVLSDFDSEITVDGFEIQKVLLDTPALVAKTEYKFRVFSQSSG
jgi:hypothetical protein